MYLSTKYIIHFYQFLGFPIFAWRGESVDDFWWCIEKCFERKNWKPSMILDDGGDATNYCQAKYPIIFKNLIGK